MVNRLSVVSVDCTIVWVILMADGVWFSDFCKRMDGGTVIRLEI